MTVAAGRAKVKNKEKKEKEAIQKKANTAARVACNKAKRQAEADAITERKLKR